MHMKLQCVSAIWKDPLLLIFVWRGNHSYNNNHKNEYLFIENNLSVGVYQRPEIIKSSFPVVYEKYHLSERRMEAIANHEMLCQNRIIQFEKKLHVIISIKYQLELFHNGNWIQQQQHRKKRSCAKIISNVCIRQFSKI